MCCFWFDEEEVDFVVGGDLVVMGDVVGNLYIEFGWYYL